MEYLDEYRDRGAATALIRAIRKEAKQKWVIMEVCGGQTHSLLRFGIDRLLEDAVELVHGPGCPVCVTALETIDKAHAIARRPEVIFASFGDMLRVPGSECDLLALKARGADVRIVYSPMDALALARKHPDREVVFFGIGFETTAPANAMALRIAQEKDVSNFSMLVSHVLVPPSISYIAQAADNRVQAFLGPGHVCAITGFRAYHALSRRYGLPIVISGFEPIDLLRGILSAVRQLERGEARVENTYERSVSPDGNAEARAVIADVFETTDRKWRGMGWIPKSGLRIRWEYRAHDAERRFDVGELNPQEPAACISGLVLRGLRRPDSCPAFGKRCTPSTPLGATMVSSEGACAAYFQYGRHLDLFPGDRKPSEATP